MHTTSIHLALAAALLACAHPVLAADAAADPVRAMWRARAQLAARKLAGPGLDACDRGVEQAFLRAEESVSGKLRAYVLSIEIDGERLLVAYNYKGERLESFSIASLPPGWFAYQKTNSKTFTVLLGEGSKCALDLCTTDPGADGPCAASDVL